MKQSTNGIKVSIMGHEYSVACAEEQRAALTQAAFHLDQKMRDIQKSGKIIGLEKCAIMAALNITHELLELRQHSDETTDMGTRLRDLQQKIDAAMQEQKQLSI